MVPDPFLYAEIAAGRHVVVNSLEHPRLAALDRDLERAFARGVRDRRDDRPGANSLRGGASRSWCAPAATLGVDGGRRCRASSRSSSPTTCAPPVSRSRPTGSSSTRAGASRARPSSPASAARRLAAEAGMRAAAALLRAAEPGAGGLFVDGEALTCERVKAAIDEAVAAAGATLGDALIVSHGAQTAIGHELGSGPIAAGEPVVIDLWPRDPDSACFADMTRTFVVGEVPEEIRRFHALTREALERSRDGRAAGRPARDVLRPRVRALRAGGHADAAHQGAGRDRSSAASSTRSATASASRSTRRRCSAAAPDVLAGRRRRHARAGLLRARDRAAAGSRTSCSSPRTAARR